MFALEPWPDGPFDPAELTPFPDPPDFETLVTDAVARAHDAGDVLETTTARARDTELPDVEQEYDRSIGAAADAHGRELAAGDAGVPDDVVEPGQNVESLRTSVASNLPPPDAPLDTTFIDPPHPALDLARFPPSGGGYHVLPPGDPRGRQEIMDAIAQMYRDLLFREPDDAGLKQWTDEVLLHAQTLPWVRQQLMDSDEYRQKHAG